MSTQSKILKKFNKFDTLKNIPKVGKKKATNDDKALNDSLLEEVNKYSTTKGVSLEHNTWYASVLRIFKKINFTLFQNKSSTKNYVCR